ncbi:MULTISPECIES: MFS transporter [Paraburkholderia]|uniref:MFS transporter n=1 Tax=Paraburkholderia TaxID=1822464 RepID=UPI0003636B40|nr:MULTISPECIES: MFS transporter [Paraburkholderia]MDH6152421.1 MFS family permease [Paraburkholderia sp. WSM4179]
MTGSSIYLSTGERAISHAEHLPASLQIRAFIPFLIASLVIAASYGTSFLLPEYLQSLGMKSDVAGAVISSGMVSTMICCCVAGRIAQRIGVMPTIALASLVTAGSMLCFAAAPMDIRAVYAGGLLLGAGWSVFFILAPLQIIHHLAPNARIQYLTFVSGTQMAGLGMAAPLSRLIAHHTGSIALAYLLFAAACAVAAVCVKIANEAMSDRSCLPMTRVAITATDTLALLRARTAVPIAMIALAACVFAGLATYQTPYAVSRNLRPDLFFLTFTITSVALRLSLARTMGRIKPARLALALFLLTGASLVLFLLNRGSTTLYIVATALFATGYGLSYSTLNGMAVNLAGDHGVSVAVTSQICTLAYFIGLFGCPFLCGDLIHVFGADAMLVVLLGAVLANVVLLGVMRMKAHFAA